jgi:hypothetical protein
MKNITVKENKGFRLRVESKKCVTPDDLNHVQFIQECFDKDGNLDFTSNYQFFLTDSEIKHLAKELSND